MKGLPSGWGMGNEAWGENLAPAQPWFLTELIPVFLLSLFWVSAEAIISVFPPVSQTYKSSCHRVSFFCHICWPYLQALLLDLPRCCWNRPLFPVSISSFILVVGFCFYPEVNPVFWNIQMILLLLGFNGLGNLQTVREYHNYPGRRHFSLISDLVTLRLL